MPRLLSLAAGGMLLVQAAFLFAGGASDATAATKPGAAVSQGGYPIVKEPVTISLIYSRAPTYGDWNEMLFFKEMEKLTNIKVAGTGIDSTAYQEKKNLLLASGDLPDVIWDGISIQDEYVYGVQGKVLQSYSPMVDRYMPNFRKALEQYKGLKARTSALDGNIYTLPVIADTLTIADTTMYVRMDWLARVGAKKPTTTAELYSVLKAFQNAYPDSYPMSMVWEVLKATLVPAFGPQIEPWYDTDSGGRIVVVPATDQYKEMLRYLNRLYSEKLLDNEIFTQQAAAIQAKARENKVGFMNYGTLLTPANFGSGNYEIEIVVPLTSELTTKPKNRGYSGVSLGFGAITSRNKYPEATARWFDIGYSDEDVAPGLNGLSIWLGIRGVSWDYTNAEKTMYRRIVPADTQYSEVEYMTQKITPGWGPAKLAFRGVPASSVSQYMKATESVKNWFPYNLRSEFPIAVLRYTPEEQTRINTLRTDLETYVRQMEAKFVSGTESFAAWDAYLGNLKRIGIDEFSKILQSAYDRYLKNS